MVACMGLGAVLLVDAADALLRPMPVRIASIAALVTGLRAVGLRCLPEGDVDLHPRARPFLIPTLRARRPRWLRLCRRRRMLLGLAGAGVLLPLVPNGRPHDCSSLSRMCGSTARSLRSRASRNGCPISSRTRMRPSVHASRDGRGRDDAAARRDAFPRPVDWLSVGFVVVALTFVLFAAATGVVASRYYLPSIVLTAIALARISTQFGRCGDRRHRCDVDPHRWLPSPRCAWVGAGVGGRRASSRGARARGGGSCGRWLRGRRHRGQRRARGGLTRPRPARRRNSPWLRPGDALSSSSTATPRARPAPDDPVLAPCAPEPEPVFTSRAGEILRCTT